MRVLPLFPLILLLAIPARSYEPAATRFVLVASPLIRFVPTEKQLREWCGAPGAYEACTRFISFRLEGTCAPAGEGEGWAMSAKATFRPWIFIRGAAHLMHEHEHVRDVERFTGQHVAGLEALEFRNADDCRARALHESASFGETMRGFARRSNEGRHPVLRRVNGEALSRVARGSGERP